MKNVLMVLSLIALASPAFANDSENKAETTVDTSTNPITGTVKTTKKTHRKIKNGKSHANMDTTEVTKKKTDGTTEKSVEVNGDSTSH
jgi:uncharacterized protein YpuA (DUF1002 family)